jgi:hypothetical protein
MRLSDEHIAQFKTLYRERFRLELTDEQAHEKGRKLVRLMELTYKPMKKDEFVRVQERRAQFTKLITKK